MRVQMATYRQTCELEYSVPPQVEKGKLASVAVSIVGLYMWGSFCTIMLLSRIGNLSA